MKNNLQAENLFSHATFDGVVFIESRFPYLVDTNRTWESTFQDYDTPAKTFYQPREKHDKVPQFCSNLYQLKIIKKFDNGDGNIQVTALCWRKILVDNKARALTLELSLNYDLLICQISQELLSNNQNFGRGLKRGLLSFTSDTLLVRPQCWLWLPLSKTITYPSEHWPRHLLESFKLGDASHQTVFCLKKLGQFSFDQFDNTFTRSSPDNTFVVFKPITYIQSPSSFKANIKTKENPK